jgi:hypothetical protein
MSATQTASTSAANRRQLNIGVLVNSLDVQFWIHELVRKVVDDPELELAFVVVNGTTHPPKEWRSVAAKAINNNFLFNRFGPRDEERAHLLLEWQPRHDLTPLLGDTPIIEAVAITTRYSDRFDDATLDAIRSYAPDVILRFGFRIIRGEILRIAPYGVWSFHHGDNRKYRGGPAGFWEVANDDPESGATLQVLSETLDGGRVLGRVFRRTHPTSPAINRYRLMRSGIILFDYAINRLKTERPAPEEFHERYTQSPGIEGSTLYRAPGNRTMLKVGARIFGRQLRSRLPWHRGKVQWSVGLINSTLAHPRELPTRTADFITPPPGMFLADPFLVRRHGEACLFVEEFDFAAGKAHISVIALNDGQAGPPEKVLEAPHHLSFPCVFEYGGEYFMIPEQSKTLRLSLYRCTAFPHRWVHERVLIEGIEVVDPVLFQRDGLWWLLFSRGDYSNYDNNLHVYYAPALDAQFMPHPKNPVRSTLQGARMAGYPFMLDGALIRPAQNCMHQYGGSMIFQQLVELSPEDYVEQELCRITSRRGSRFGHGIHTYSALPDLVAIDGYRLIPER